MVSLVIQTTLGQRALCDARDSEEHNDAAVDPQQVGIVENANLTAQPASVNRRDLVNHEATRGIQAVRSRRGDLQPKERGVGGVGGEGADGDGVRVEMIVLQDQGRPRFAGVVTSTSDSPDLASSQSSGQSDTESTNA